MKVEIGRASAAMQPSRVNIRHGITFQQYYDIIRDQIKQEDQLIGTRMGWLTTSQTILFGFYANGARSAASADSIGSLQSQSLGFNGPSMLPSAHAYPIIAVVGLAMTLLIYVSILAAVRNINKLRWHIEDIVSYVDENGTMHPVPNVTPSLKRIWRAGLLAPKVVPAIFAIAWIFVAIFWLEHAK